MAITIVATVGSASANSYVTETEFQTYFEQRLNTAAVENADPDRRQRAMLMAFRRLNLLGWIGSRVTTTQAGAWPRANARKPDDAGVSADSELTLAATYALTRGDYGIYSAPYPTYTTTEIPQRVKDAQCELACAYLDGFDEHADRMTSVSQDGLSYQKQFARPLNGLPGVVMRLLGPLLEGPRLVRG